MKLNHGVHLAYCTNVHRGETWEQTFQSLKTSTMAVRDKVCSGAPFAIGLRLGERAARQLSDGSALLEFQRWLGTEHCYVFTINGFPYGQFHAGRVKEQVYLPDWSAQSRLDYTKLLFELLAQLVPPGIEGSVSTVPCGFKQLVSTPEELKAIRANLWHCVEHIARLSQQTGRNLHLGLEPEPLCLLESSGEVIQFFDRMRSEHRNDPRLLERMGVNYDTCHFAIEFEEPQDAIGCLRAHGIKISKIHLSSALKVVPTREGLEALAQFVEPVYLHQVVIRRPDGGRVIYQDLDDALACETPEASPEDGSAPTGEWRVHFHIPLHSPPVSAFDNTSDHLLGTMDLLRADPSLCSHLEMETYTWEVLPAELRQRDVVDQIVSEYHWTLCALADRGLATLG